MLRTLRYLLWPFSILYGFAVWFRNQAYDRGVFKSQSVDIPIIVIGNLAVGGAGKSPMTEYLIRLLQNRMRVATLSRGYGRKTRGFRYVSQEDDATQAGDEPLQFKRKFPDVTVAVCEKRVVGVEKLQAEHDVVILDDAYQHRALKPGFSLLLFDYTSLFNAHLLLPAGDFRDTFDQRKRADIIIVSKSPETLSPQDKQGVRKRLRVPADLPVLFSHLTYGQAYRLGTSESAPEKKSQNLDAYLAVLVLTGIANPIPLVNYVKTHVKQVKLLKFPDHHQFTEGDLQNLADQFAAIKELNKVILTTEKDAQRLKATPLAAWIQSLPIVVLPIETMFNKADGEVLSTQLFAYLGTIKKAAPSTI